MTRVNRSGVDLVAHPSLILQLGDRLTVVGSELAIGKVSKMLGNSLKRLNHPNLIPIFLGIALGCVVANIPLLIPGIPEPVRLGLAGGPFIVAILMGYFGPRYHLVTYNTISANMMLREIGITMFLACVEPDKALTAACSTHKVSHGLRMASSSPWCPSSWVASSAASSSTSTTTH